MVGNGRVQLGERGCFAGVCRFETNGQRTRHLSSKTEPKHGDSVNGEGREAEKSSECKLVLAR
jgi:hypothetical protein